MFLLTYLAQPNPDSPPAVEVEGAYVNAWIVAADQAEADKVATEWITGNDWQIQALDNCEIVSESTYDTDNPNRKYFEQAIIDKAVFVYHTWPHGSDEEQTIQ